MSVPLPVWWTDLSCPCPIKCLCPALLLPFPATSPTLYFLLAHSNSHGRVKANRRHWKLLQINRKFSVAEKAVEQIGGMETDIPKWRSSMSCPFPAEWDCLSLLEWDPSLWLLPVCCSAVSSSSWFLEELRPKNPNQEWNKVRTCYGKNLAGCQEGGFASKALCVLVLLIRNESKGLTMVRATDKFPVWGVGSSQKNSHSCPWCLHSRAQHFQQEQHGQWAEPLTELLLQTPQSFHQNCLCQSQLQCSADSFSEETTVLISYLSTRVPKWSLCSNILWQNVGVR